MTRYVCVHGHFYQPPRENPSLEAIELQDSAYPYHDWNERVSSECYAPNGSSRILNDEGEITEIVNNYARISFNFGPTLISWIEEKAPKVYELILQADRDSQKQFAGHGSAIAQVYNHMILPLANRRDKETQIKWGIADFEYRFKRKPEGMWLSETAVNAETLEVLAENGIRFTILAPRQAKQFRSKKGGEWIDVSKSDVDPSRAYLVELSSGKTINVFFYDGPIAQAVAFEGLLNNGQQFANRLLSGFSDERTWPQLVNIATDGESYGHHHHGGEMALSYALHHIEKNKLATLVNYGQFLEMFPPDQVAEIIDDSSWSCVHGIERWRSNCGCNSGGYGDWNQEWRVPLRASLDWLRDALAPIYEKAAADLLKNPWEARNAYIRVILDRSDESLAAFWKDHATRELNSEEQVRALKLLEMQRHAMLMYTSCGWFFDDISGLETVQVIHYAGRALRLAEECGGAALEAEFVNRLSAAKSNIREQGNGGEIYEKWVKPAYVSMPMVAGHYAISSIFENYEPQSRIYCYRVDCKSFEIESEGVLKLVTGTARFQSHITHESDDFAFAAVHLGDHNLLAGVRKSDAATDQAQEADLKALFARSDTAEIIRKLDADFNKQIFSLKTLFRDEQRKITKQLLDGSMRAAAAAYRSIYETQAPLFRFLNGLGIPIPAQLHTAVEIALNNQLQEALEQPEPDQNRILAFFREAADAQVKTDATTLEFAIRRKMEDAANRFAEHPDAAENVHQLNKLVALSLALPFQVNLWQVQNTVYAPLLQVIENTSRAQENNGAQGKALLAEFLSLKNELKIQGTGAKRHAAGS